MRWSPRHITHKSTCHKKRQNTTYTTIVCSKSRTRRPGDSICVHRVPTTGEPAYVQHAIRRPHPLTPHAWPHVRDLAARHEPTRTETTPHASTSMLNLGHDHTFSAAHDACLHDFLTAAPPGVSVQAWEGGACRWHAHAKTNSELRNTTAERRAAGYTPIRRRDRGWPQT